MRGISPNKGLCFSLAFGGLNEASNHGSSSIFFSDFGTEVFSANGVALLSFHANSIFIDAYQPRYLPWGWILGKAPKRRLVLRNCNLLPPWEVV